MRLYSHEVNHRSRAKDELPSFCLRGARLGMPRKPEEAPTPERSKQAVGRRLQILRRARDDESAKDISSAVNVQPNTWHYWEIGKNMADVWAMTRVADLTGVTLDYIYMGSVSSLPQGLAAKIRMAAAILSTDDQGDQRTEIEHSDRVRRVRQK